MKTMTKTTKAPAKAPAKAVTKAVTKAVKKAPAKASKAAAVAVDEAPISAKPIVYASGQIAAVHAQPFTRPPAFVPKKPRGS